MKQNVLWWWHLVWIHVFEKLAAQRLLSRAAFAGIEIEHVVKEIEGSWWDAERQQRQNTLKQKCQKTQFHIISRQIKHKRTKQTPLASGAGTASLVSWCWRREALLHPAKQQDRGSRIFGCKTVKRSVLKNIQLTMDTTDMRGYICLQQNSFLFSLQPPVCNENVRKIIREKTCISFIS